MDEICMYDCEYSKIQHEQQRESAEQKAIWELRRQSDVESRRVSPSKNCNVCPWLNADQQLNHIYSKNICSPQAGRKRPSTVHNSRLRIGECRLIRPIPVKSNINTPKMGSHAFNKNKQNLVIMRAIKCTPYSLHAGFAVHKKKKKFRHKSINGTKKKKITSKSLSLIQPLKNKSLAEIPIKKKRKLSRKPDNARSELMIMKNINNVNQFVHMGESELSIKKKSIFNDYTRMLKENAVYNNRSSLQVKYHN